MTAPRPAEALGEDLSRLAGLHGVATSYSPSQDRTVAASSGAVVAVLAALGVDAGTPQTARAASPPANRSWPNGCCRPQSWAGTAARPPRSTHCPKVPGCTSRPSRARHAPPPDNSLPVSTS